MSDREFKWQKLSAGLLEMDGATGFRGEFFSVDKCLGAGIKGGEQGFREEKALGCERVHDSRAVGVGTTWA